MAGSTTPSRGFDYPYPPTEFRADRSEDTPEVRAAWHRYVRDRNRADFNLLLIFYLPMVRMVAMKLKKRRPGVFRDPVDEMVSDGVLGLARGIRSFKPGDRIFYKRMAQRIGQEIGYHNVQRRWGGEYRREHRRTALRIRRDLVMCLGRVPTGEELAHALRDQLGITNANLYVGDREIHARSQIERDSDQYKYEWAVDDRCAPLERMIDGEAVKIASARLKPADRRVFKLLLDGTPVRQIGKELGLTHGAAQRRCNGVLWELRCHRELAEHLGVEPARRPPCRASLLPPVSMLPPARRLAS